MNYFSKILSGTVVLLALGTNFGCNSKSLDIPPPTPAESNYFSNENEYKTAIFGVYALLSDYYSSSNIPGGSGSTEMETFFLPGADITTSAQEAYELFGNRMNSTEGKLAQVFGSSYVLCNRANKVIASFANVKDGVFQTPGLENWNKGEVYFLRGFAHYMLWNLFGTAPLDTANVVSASQFNPPSSQGTELLDQAISDFTTAASLLPASWDAADLGRVTANSAYGMLGKSLVFRATVNKDAADYQAALTAFSKISGVSLVANFEDNFDWEQENNAESLFEYQSGSNINGFTNGWLSNDAADVGVASGFWQCYGGGQTYVGGGLWIATDKLASAFDPADPRLPLTLNTSNNNITKYVLKGKPESVVNDLDNYRILRYADVLLLEAEATIQSGGSASAAIGFINQVRARARSMVGGGTVPADLNTAETDPATIMQWIMDERLRELGGEGQNWFDIRRWALGGQITLDNDYFSSVNPTQMSWDNHYLFFPIPSSEKDKNPNIVQNPGY
ncbi:MAG TPA: RagB/SusD family nutrient uptake outer membrane protein [Puia sp.]|nr:RagB/SusD family nutrient uptake outer membrane protein [Puia sp.]